MPDASPSSTSDTLSDLLLRWQNLRDAGQEIAPETLCADRPELLSELRRQIDAVRSMEHLLAPGANGTLPMAGPVFVAPPPPKAVPGYEILSELGRGGMGVVYQARQISLNRTVALKMILAGSHAGSHQQARFRAEAEALARLRHPNIVQVYEVGEQDGLPWFSLEYVEGGNLGQRLAGIPMEARAAAELVAQLARAMQAAHEQGIVHRDLKPANILLAACDPSSAEARPLAAIPKVTDFGLAKMLDSHGQTHSGAVLGTPAYMAPEQAEGKTKAIGPGVDIYSLGALLYECLTGRPPFVGDTVAKILLEVAAHDPVAPSRIGTKIPRDLETICLKCLRKAPGERYATAAALADDLKRFLEGRPITARPVGVAERAAKWLRRRPERLLLAGVVLLVPLIALAFWPRSGAPAEPQDDLAPRARAVLRKYCFACHGSDPEAPEGDLLILDREHLLAHSIVVPGDPKGSLMIERIEDSSMPPLDQEAYPRLGSTDIEVLKKWIAAGAPAFEGPTQADLAPPPPPSPDAIAVRALFVARCRECHDYRSAKGGIRILNHDLLVEKRRLVIPGDPDSSPLWKSVTNPDEKKRMPPKKHGPLKKNELDLVHRWIIEGAAPFPLTVGK